jgi:hypothetical protein
VQQTLETLQKYYLDKTAYDVRVVLVDNGSSDGTPDMVRDEFEWVELIELEENRGFAGGNNVALNQVNERYCLLLNTDMELDERSDFDRLIEYMDEHPSAGIVSPRVELPDGSLDWACHRGEPRPWAAFSYFTQLEKLFPKSETFAQYHQRYKSLNEIHTIDACTAAAMLVRATAMEEVGLLDERFFMYAEDLDWCKRFREAGHKVVFHPGAVIIHHKNKSGIDSSSSSTAKTTSAAFYDTMLQYYDKHYRTQYPQWVRALIQLAITLLKGVNHV